jgi:hypothetical protein
VPRLANLSERFLRSRTRLGIQPGSPRGVAVAAAIRALLAAPALPSPGDTRALVPPTGEAFVRRVPGQNLWIWYRANEETLYVALVSSDPPVPLDG